MPYNHPQLKRNSEYLVTARTLCAEPHETVHARELAGRDAYTNRALQDLVAAAMPPGAQDTAVPDLSDDDIAPLRCSITLSLIEDPVLASDGYTYERRAIEAWLVDHYESPITRGNIKDRPLIPNIVLRTIIQDYRAGASPQRTAALGYGMGERTAADVIAAFKERLAEHFHPAFLAATIAAVASTAATVHLASGDFSDAATAGGVSSSSLVASGSLSLHGSSAATGDASISLGELSTLSGRAIMSGLFGAGSSSRPSDDGETEAAAAPSPASACS